MASLIIQAILAIAGLGGLLTGLVAWKKLKPEAATAAVAQADQALEMMQRLNQEQQAALERAYERIVELEAQVARQQQALVDGERMIQQLREFVHGVRIGEDDRNFPPGRSINPEERTPPT